MAKRRWKVATTFAAGVATQIRPEPDLPPLMRMVGNAGRAALSVVAGSVRGERVMAGAEELARRQRICHEQCPEWWRRSDDRCAHPDCGCRMRWKRLLLTLHCPAGKW